MPASRYKIEKLGLTVNVSDLKHAAKISQISLFRKPIRRLKVIRDKDDVFDIYLESSMIEGEYIYKCSVVVTGIEKDYFGGFEFKTIEKGFDKISV